MPHRSILVLATARYALVALTSIFLFCVGCQPHAAKEAAELHNFSKDTQTGGPIALPPARQDGRRSLEMAVASRRSVREFIRIPLTDVQLSQLLWAAQGITDANGLRAAPSAGALYPLELYVATAQGLYHYKPAEHALLQSHADDLRRSLHEAALHQEAVAEAPAVFVITAVYSRTASKYGDRAERYVWMEAGHAAQNLLLQAVALDLGGVPIGAFDDQQVSDILRLPGNESPLYLIPIGHPR